VNDFRKIANSPLQIRDDVTPAELRTAMEKRQNIINAIMDVVTRQISGKEITKKMERQLGIGAEILNSEIDAMEKILVEH
jgi:hypothetical protein